MNIIGALDVLSTWSVVDGEVAIVAAMRGELVRNFALRLALIELGQRTHCTLGRRTFRGTIHWSAFRVLERWGYARRALSPYVTITRVGRAAIARCQTVVRTSAEVPPP